ncbi:hypothetical protein [Bacillus sp. FSL K6-2944]|uniref:hypothetical protein n=1 Tax=Bacillus sp. FSL K6-2944 TaxID=2921486 RepID=UPI0030F94C00
MKKFFVMIIVVLLSGCVDESSTHPERKEARCEDSKACSTALKYVTYDEQGAAHKLFEMQLTDENDKDSQRYKNEADANEHIKPDYEKFKDKKITNYAVLEYETITNKVFIYKFRFKNLRENKVINRYLRVEKIDGKYLVKRYNNFVPNSTITRGDKIVPYVKYYAKGMSLQAKEELEPKPIEKE